jgi:hypothetical protein
MSKTVKKWFKPETHSGWEKQMDTRERRRLVLIAHDGDELSAARSLQALANVTQDKATKREAALDARFFFRSYINGTSTPRITRKQPRISNHMGRLK